MRIFICIAIIIFFLKYLDMPVAETLKMLLALGLLFGMAISLFQDLKELDK